MRAPPEEGNKKSGDGCGGIRGEGGRRRRKRIRERVMMPKREFAKKREEDKASDGGCDVILGEGKKMSRKRIRQKSE